MITRYTRQDGAEATIRVEKQHIPTRWVVTLTVHPSQHQHGEPYYLTYFSERTATARRELDHADLLSRGFTPVG